jgi:hypothetical protein
MNPKKEEALGKFLLITMSSLLFVFVCFLLNLGHYNITARQVGHETSYCQIKKVRLDSGKYPTILLDVIDDEVEYSVDTRSKEVPDIKGLEAIVVTDSWEYRDGVVKKSYFFYGYKEKK